MRKNEILIEHTPRVSVEKIPKLFRRVFYAKLVLHKTQCTKRARDYKGHYPVQYLENIGPAMEQSDWSNLLIGPLAVISRVIMTVYCLCR